MDVQNSNESYLNYKPLDFNLHSLNSFTIRILKIQNNKPNNFISLQVNPPINNLKIKFKLETNNNQFCGPIKFSPHPEHKKI